MTSPAGSDVRLVSYRLLLPPGWRQLSLVGNRDETAAQLDRIIDGLVAGVEERRAVVQKWQLREEFLRQMRTAAADGGIDMYIPVQFLHGRVAAASFIVAETPAIDSGVDNRQETPLAVSALVAQREANGWESSVLDIDGAIAVRSSTRVGVPAGDTSDGVDRVGGPAAEDRPRDSLRVDYVVQAPDTRWLLFSFSTPVLSDDESPRSGPDGVRFDELLVELFDAIMTTLRWDTETAEDLP